MPRPRNGNRPARLPCHRGTKWVKVLTQRERRKGAGHRPRMREPTGQLITLHLLHSSIGFEFSVEGSCRSRETGQVERERGRRERGTEEERETDGRGSPTLGHATIWSSASWKAKSSDVGRWHWTHCHLYGQSGDELLQHHLIEDLVHKCPQMAWLTEFA